MWYGRLLAGLIAWTGIGKTNEFVISIYENRKFPLWLLHGFYQVIVSAGEGVLFALWK